MEKRSPTIREIYDALCDSTKYWAMNVERVKRGAAIKTGVVECAMCKLFESNCDLCPVSGYQDDALTCCYEYSMILKQCRIVGCISSIPHIIAMHKKLIGLRNEYKAKIKENKVIVTTWDVNAAKESYCFYGDPDYERIYRETGLINKGDGGAWIICVDDYKSTAKKAYWRSATHDNSPHLYISKAFDGYCSTNDIYFMEVTRTHRKELHHSHYSQAHKTLRVMIDMRERLIGGVWDDERNAAEHWTQEIDGEMVRMYEDYAGDIIIKRSDGTHQYVFYATNANNKRETIAHKLIKTHCLVMPWSYVIRIYGSIYDAPAPVTNEEGL